MVELLGFEQETIIRWDESSYEAEIYTASRRVAERLIKGGLEPVRREKDSWWFVVPKQVIRLKPGERSIYPAGRGGQKQKNVPAGMKS